MLQEDGKDASNHPVRSEVSLHPDDKGPAQRTKSAESTSGLQRVAARSEPKYFDEIVKPESFDGFCEILGVDLQVSYERSQPVSQMLIILCLFFVDIYIIRKCLSPGRTRQRFSCQLQPRQMTSCGLCSSRADIKILTEKRRNSLDAKC